MSTQTKPLPWPGDAVIIVAAGRGEEKRAGMDCRVAVRCRRCERPLFADVFTIVRAGAMPERKGRPVDFFCIQCCVLHDARSVEVFHDHRGRKGTDHV